MQIDFHRQYIKQLAKLTIREQQRITYAIELFVAYPNNAKLRRHQLKGEYYPQVSISAGGDLRIHFIQVSSDFVLFLAVGTHAQLYE